MLGQSDGVVVDVEGLDPDVAYCRVRYTEIKVIVPTGTAMMESDCTRI